MDQFIRAKQLNEIFKGVEIYNDILEFAEYDRDRKLEIYYINNHECKSFRTFKAFKKYIKENYIKEVYEKFKKPLICEYDEHEKRFVCGFDYCYWDYTRDKGYHYANDIFKFYLYINFEC